MTFIRGGSFLVVGTSSWGVMLLRSGASIVEWRIEISGNTYG